MLILTIWFAGAAVTRGEEAVILCERMRGGGRWLVHSVERSASGARPLPCVPHPRSALEGGVKAQPWALAAGDACAV